VEKVLKEVNRAASATRVTAEHLSVTRVDPCDTTIDTEILCVFV